MPDATDRDRGRLEIMCDPIVEVLRGSNAREIETVRWFTQQTRFPLIKGLALAANYLSNGLLYVVIGVVFRMSYGATGAVGAAATAMVLGHMLYPVIKRRYCRRRPFEFDPSVPSLLRPLDDYSIPSGHVMSCVAALTPLCIAVPAILPWAISTLLIVGWARMVAGHHYPSDLIAGAILGLLAALPIVAVQIGFG